MALRSAEGRERRASAAWRWDRVLEGAGGHHDGGRTSPGVKRGQAVCGVGCPLGCGAAHAVWGEAGLFWVLGGLRGVG